jgi:hypothetical protein
VRCKLTIEPPDQVLVDEVPDDDAAVGGQPVHDCFEGILTLKHLQTSVGHAVPAFAVRPSLELPSHG